MTWVTENLQRLFYETNYTCNGPYKTVIIYSRGHCVDSAHLFDCTRLLHLCNFKDKRHSWNLQISRGRNVQKMELATSPASYQSDVLNHAVQCHGETLHAHILVGYGT